MNGADESNQPQPRLSDQSSSSMAVKLLSQVINSITIHRFRHPNNYSSTPLIPQVDIIHHCRSALAMASFMLDCQVDEEVTDGNNETSSAVPSPPPAISRLLKRSPVRVLDEAKDLVHGRRESFLQERRDKLAHRRQLHDQVLARGRVDVRAKLEALRENLSAAQAARNAIYAQIAANSSKEVAKVQHVVSQNKEKIRLEREAKRIALEMKLAEAQSRRENALKNRQFGRRSISPRANSPPNDGMDCDTLTSSRFQDPNQAASHIQRFWRAHLATKRAKRFMSFHLDYETVGSVPFDVVADVIKGKDVILSAGQILNTLGLVQDPADNNSASLCRIFLSTFMIIGHPGEILMQRGLLEDRLNEQAKLFSCHFSRWIALTAQRRLCCQEKLLQSWRTFLAAFDSWKQDDSANLLQVMIAQYCELDLIYQIVKSDSDPIVAAEYHTAIKDNQLSLLARIRRIVGDGTVPLVRQAVGAARRKRLPRKRKPAANAKIVQTSTEVATVNPVQFFSLGQRQTRLSNRQLIHEISIDPTYHITKPRLSESETALEEQMRQNFFISLQAEIRVGRSVSWIPIVVQECKMRLLRLVMPNSPTYAAINADFDIPYVEAQCKQNYYDYLAFTTTVIKMMRALCSPARDSAVSDIELLRGVDDVDLFCKRINSIFEVLDVLLLDSANFHLSMSAPRLMPEAIPYEQKKFQEDLDTGTITLNKTTHWIQRQAAELNAEVASRDPEEIDHPSNRPTAQKVFHSAFAQLLSGAGESLPETLQLDQDRVSSYRSDFSRIISTASHLMTSRNLMRPKLRFLNPLTWTTLRDRLSILLSGTDATSLTSIAAEINNHLDRAYSGTESDRQDRHNTLTSLITKSKSTDPVHRLLTRRLQALMVTKMAGGEVTGAAIASAGLEDLTTDVQKLLTEVEILARVNWSCYKSWYLKMLV